MDVPEFKVWAAAPSLVARHAGTLAYAHAMHLLLDEAPMIAKDLDRAAGWV